MSIHIVNAKTFSSLEEGIELLKSVGGLFAILADTMPSIGTVYAIRRKSEKKMEHTVFVPRPINKWYNQHSQSDFHMHTAFWIRDRYIQRALMDHPSLSMKENSTIHSRWHITTSPLYKIEFGDLVNMIEIDGLVGASLPAFLSSEPNLVAKDNDADTTLTSPKK